jgi:L-asparaginase / beta-aspartyl-peptidase
LLAALLMDGRARWTAIAHGGASSLEEDSDGPTAACEAAIEVLRRGGNVLDAAVRACVLLEDDPRFNAGTGSNLRLDGKTIEMDASCMTDDGKYGAVACLREVKNPVLVAQKVHATPHNLLAGEGAIAFARALGHPPYDPYTERAKLKYEAVRKAIRLVQAAGVAEWDMERLSQNWNYTADMKSAFGSDTVGAVVGDGVRCAAASSTGGTISTLFGRVGDVPMIGGGIWAGPRGGVAVTGDGDFLARRLLAHHVYRALDAGAAPEAAIQEALGLVPEPVDVGVILLFEGRTAAGSRRGMAWGRAEAAP